MKILPIHEMKLKWLLSQVAVMNQNDATYIKEIYDALLKVNYEDAHPITIIMIDHFYEQYNKIVKQNKETVQ